jgi:regulator of sigma E protease
MLEYIITVLSFIVAVGVLATVHEFGHFLIARLCGVRVLQFSIGFGKSLLRWNDRYGTEYMISLIPLGGYVRMLGEDDDIVSMTEQHMAFNNKSVFIRMLIICAGPFANIIFAVLSYWLVFMIGVSSIVPMLGTVPKGTVAYVANLKKGQEIISVNDQLTPTWEDVSVSLMPYLGDKGFVKIKAYNKNTKKYTNHMLNLTDWTVDNAQGDILKSLGIEPFDPVLPVVGKLISEFPAIKSGILPGDLIIAVDDIQVDTRTQVTNYLRKKAGSAVSIKVIRDKKKYIFWVTPIKKLAEGGEEVGFVGIQYQPTPWPKELIKIHKFGPLDSLKRALLRTKQYTELTIQFLQKIITGKISLQHVAGPISIAKYAGQSIQLGIESFLSFLALVSINLGVLNLVLPIPILDGGHILFCFMELFTGAPPSPRAVEISRLFGVIFLASLMLLALYNDILRL